MKRSLVLLAAFVVLGAASAQADVTAGTQTTSSGAVSAMLSWQAGPGPVNTTLTITRNGSVVFNQPIPDICDDLCVRDADDPETFQTIDLDGDGEPEILVLGSNTDRFDGTDGNDDDDTLGIFHWDAAFGRYRELFAHFPFVTFAHDHGTLEIVAEDTRFADVQPGLDTPPARVFEYAAGAKLDDVSRTAGRAQVREDLHDRTSDIDQIVSGQTAHLRAEMIGYVGDEYLLGRGAVAIRRLDRLIAQHRLGTPASAAAFRKRLTSALRRNRYSKPPER